MKIAEFFTGQRILVTGGTGFIGKVLLEKLLRSCPGIDAIYLLIRAKKGLTPEERWATASQVPLFDSLRALNPDALKKIKLIQADMKDPTLGISESDRKDIIENVTIVYHIAATVQFADNIIDTLEQNTRATYLMVELAKQIQNLQVMVYVSTCYTNFYRPRSEWNEEIYPPVQDWRTILKLMEREPLQLARIKEKLLCGHPNPYTFSKSLAEQIFVDYSSQLKAAVILRPSVVMPAVDEPLKGWVDSLNGMAVLCIANSFGILRVALHTNEAHQDYVPVDTVAKGIIVSTWITTTKKPEDFPLIYNCTVGDLLKIRTSDISRIASKCNYIEEYPSKFIVWTRDLKLVKNKYKYNVQFFLEQILPACVLDLAIYLYGAQPLFLKIAKKLAYSNQILFKDFAFEEVHFQNQRFLALLREIEPEEKTIFSVPQLEDPSKVSLEDTLRDTYIGVLKYFFKEDLSEKNIIRNKKRYKRIIMLSQASRVLFYSSLGYVTYKYFELGRIATFLQL